MGPPIRRMTGVYHTDGGLRGELAYAIGKIRGTAHCALCDITHRGLRTKPAWTALVADIPVPFGLVHLNERTPQVAAASDGHTPCVLAHTDDGLVRLLGPEDLDRLAGDVTRFATALRAAAGRAGLHLPTIADPPVCGRHGGRYGRCPGRPFRPTADRAAGRPQHGGPAPGLRSSRCCAARQQDPAAR